MLQVPIYYLIASNGLLVLAAVIINRWACKRASEVGKSYGRKAAAGEGYWRGWHEATRYASAQQASNRLSVLEQRLNEIRAKQNAPN